MTKPIPAANTFIGKKKTCVLDISNQKHHIAAQPIIVELMVQDTEVAVDITKYAVFALVLNIRLVSINFDERRFE